MPHSPYPISCHTRYTQSHATCTLTVSNLMPHSPYPISFPTHYIQSHAALTVSNFMPHSSHSISCHTHRIQSHAALTISNLKEIRIGSCRHAVENGVPIDVIGVDVIDKVPRALGVCWLHVHCDCNGEDTVSDVCSLRTGALVSLLVVSCCYW